MDPLFNQAKQMYPNASDEEINQNLAKIRQEAPDASDDEIVKAATQIQGSQQDGTFGKMAVKETLKQKYGLGEYSPDKRKELLDANDKAASPIASAFAGFGAGIRGGNVSSAFDSAMAGSQAKTKGAIDAFDKARDQKKADFAFDRDLSKAEREDTAIGESKDPASARSKAAQDMLVQDYGMDPAVASKMTAEQVEARLPGLKQKLDREMREREFSERQKDRNLQREQMQANRDITRNDKLDAKNEKKKATLTEVEDRRMNIEDNISRLEKMIDEKGTYEMFGSHNADMERLTDQIATDMAKLTDPNSVARPSEVEMFKKGLVSPNAASMTNATAKDILKNFRNEVNTRAATAYKVRGLENPGAAAPKEETKVMGGKTYRKVPGGWEEVE